jgi:Flp pilus assembly protein TadG
MTKHTLVGDNSGQTIIEMVLCAPLFLLLLLGAVEYGRLWYVSIEVTNAAHAGVEYGSQNRIVAQDNANIQQVSLNDEADLINKNVNASGVLTPLGTSSISVQQLCANVYSATPGACSTSTPSPIEYVQVNSQVRVDSLFNFFGFPQTYTLHGAAIMRVRD